MKNLGKARDFDQSDPPTKHRHDEKFVMAERLITIMRGTSFICGVGKAHSPTNMWLDMAQDLLAEHDATVAVEDATTDHVKLDLEPVVKEGATTLPAAVEDDEAWKLDVVPVDGGGDEEFFEVE